jgi:hypothetical protein
MGMVVVWYDHSSEIIQELSFKLLKLRGLVLYTKIEFTIVYIRKLNVP